jgi:DNA-directed RNA polymerase specialized sigma24 family protein
MPLTEKSRLILEAIAKGHTYEQILVQELAWTYHDIFAAAAEALGQSRVPQPTSKVALAPTPGTTSPNVPAYSVEEIRIEHMNAYRAWSPEEEGELRQLHAEGLSVDAICARIGRQPGGVRSRLRKLGLIRG